MPEDSQWDITAKYLKDTIIIIKWIIQNIYIYISHDVEQDTRQATQANPPATSTCSVRVPFSSTNWSHSSLMKRGHSLSSGRPSCLPGMRSKECEAHGKGSGIDLLLRSDVRPICAMVSFVSCFWARCVKSRISFSPRPIPYPLYLFCILCVPQVACSGNDRDKSNKV